jgi:hypothetical protein
VNRPDVGGVEPGQRVVEQRLARAFEVGHRQLPEQALANAQAQLASRLSGEGDRRQAADRERGRAVRRRDHFNQAVDKDRGLARACARVDEHVARALVHGGVALGLVGGRRPARTGHVSPPPPRGA